MFARPATRGAKAASSSRTYAQFALIPEKTRLTAIASPIYMKLISKVHVLHATPNAKVVRARRRTV